MFTVILANTISMASMDMRDRDLSAAESGFETASTILYACEALVKIIDQGFAWDQGAYMHSGWNQFDFVLVLGTLVSLFESSLGSQFLALRAFRCFRPLRAMKSFRDGQLLMRTTLTALPLLRDAFIFLAWFMLVASVSGTMIFGGALRGRCVSDADAAGLAPLDARGCPATALVGEEGAICDRKGRGNSCGVGETCCDSDHYPLDDYLSFDDFTRSAILVLQITAIDGWNELAVANAEAAGLARVAPYYFIIVFFGGFYVMQLFTSVMIITLSHSSEQMDEQEAEEEALKKAGLEHRGERRFDLQDDKVGELINSVGEVVKTNVAAFRAWLKGPKRDPKVPRRERLPQPVQRACRTLQKVVVSVAFQRAILGVICLNTITMAMNAHGQSDEYYAYLYWFEFAFTVIFIAEFALKHIAYGPVWYWSNPWNVIDGAIVISGILELSMGSGAQGVALLRMFRVLRILAGLKGLRRFRAFQQVFAAVYNGVSRIASFCVVFFLFITVFAILGMQLFGGLSEMRQHRSHFDTFGDAVLTLFIICTGENTYSVGWDLIQASGTTWAVVYVAVWSLVSTSLLALVLGVLIEAAAQPVLMSETLDGIAAEIGEDEDEELDVDFDSIEMREDAAALSRSPSSVTPAEGTSTPRSLGTGDEKLDEVDDDLAVLRATRIGSLERTRSDGKTTDAVTGEERDATPEEIAAAGRRLEELMAETKVEVAAVRLWLDEHDLYAAGEAEVIRTEFVNGAVKQTVTQRAETADDVRSRYTAEEFALARRRLVTQRPSEVASILGYDKDDTKHVKFRVVGDRRRESIKEILARKARNREIAIKEERERQKLGEEEHARRLFEARAAEVGITPEDGVRLRCLAFAEHRWTRNAILLMIIVSACLLAPQCDKDWPAEGSDAEFALQLVDYFFTAAFAVEMGVKLKAYTVYSGPRAYVKDYWNCLDGFIVIMSFVTIILSQVSGNIGGVMKVFRVLRVLRPLRVIKNIPSLKLVIDATFVSLPSILTVCAMGFMTFLILGVLGMNLFKGQFYRCSVPNVGGTRATCLENGGEWENAPIHFNNIGQSAVAIFIMSTGDDWQDIMWYGTDIAGVDNEPVEMNSPWAVYFFITCVLVAFFFWANLFVSSLVDNFSQVAAQIKAEDGESGTGYTYSEAQRKWLLALKAGIQAQKDSWREENPMAMHPARRVFFRLRKWKHWEKFVTFFITANAVQLCFIREGTSAEEDQIMEQLSIVFCVLYVFETGVNIAAMSWRTYVDNGWNRLDFTVTALGVLEMFVLISGAGGAGFVTVFRTARFFRLFKLLKSSSGLRSLVDTFITAMPGMLNILGLMLLLMHIYACLGCTLYGSVPGPYDGDGLTKYTNFQNWGNAMSLLFVTMSGNWARVFIDVYWECATMEAQDELGGYGGCGYRYSAIVYFFTFVVFGIYLLANLFVAILLERFDYSSTMEGVYDERNPIDTLCRLNIIRHFIVKIRNRLRLSLAVKTEKERRRRESMEKGGAAPKPLPSIRTMSVNLGETIKHGTEQLKGRIGFFFAGRGTVTRDGAANLVSELSKSGDLGKLAEADEVSDDEDPDTPAPETPVMYKNHGEVIGGLGGEEPTSPGTRGLDALRGRQASFKKRG